MLGQVAADGPGGLELAIGVKDGSPKTVVESSAVGCDRHAESPLELAHLLGMSRHETPMIRVVMISHPVCAQQYRSIDGVKRDGEKLVVRWSSRHRFKSLDRALEILGQPRAILGDGT